MFPYGFFYFKLFWNTSNTNFWFYVYLVFSFIAAFEMERNILLLVNFPTLIFNDFLSAQYFHIMNIE